MLKAILKPIFKFLYKVEINNLENFYKTGDRVMIVANHLSFLDGILLALFLPEKPTFAINSRISQRWYIKPFLTLVKHFALEPLNPYAAKTIIDEIKKNNKCVIFPEGRITVTGSLMKIYEGPAMIADKTGADILPIRIEGAQYSKFSRVKKRVRTRFFPKITLTILEPTKLKVDENIKGRARRSLLGTELYDLMSNMLFESSNYNRSIIDKLVEQVHIHGRKHVISEDINRTPINYGQLLTRIFILSKELKKHSEKNENVGVMLPNMVSSVITFFSLQITGRTPAMINFSLGQKNLYSCCKTANIKKIITSKQFIAKGKLDDIMEYLQGKEVQIIYLEDIAKNITKTDKIKGLIKSFSPNCFYKSSDSEDTAVILFTSGSEGLPKGVALSHKNILSNCYQLAARIDFGVQDIVFNALPIFHSFGLTGGTLLPMLFGIKTFFYPSPLHYRIVPELVYDTNATIMFGTDTFLTGYAKYANSYDFYSLRYVFAGAEKLKEANRKIWSEKFGVRILEGYGATETSPAISINTPMHNKAGTVGRLLPSIDYKLEPVEGIENGGRLIVSGTNIMKGYLLHDKPGELQPPQDGLYDTGDIVSVDDQGFLKIEGRAKRFAKVGGEMVSLTAVENYIAKLWPESSHAVINVDDQKKGEALILFTTKKEAKRADITKYVKANGLSELSIPKKIVEIEEIPLLGTGKIDYNGVKELNVE